MNRLRMEHRATRSAAEREIDRIDVRRKKLIQIVMESVSSSEVTHALRRAKPPNRTEGNLATARR
jgi:hypothetical protein